MTLYFIGIGLNDEKDITLKGLEAIKNSKHVYLEYYTSKLHCSVQDLEKLYDKKIIIADRNKVENEADEILNLAKDNDVSFLVMGDIFAATTHMDFYLRANEKNIETVFIHNASILTAIGETGLELYKFGKVTSIPFHNENVVTPLEVFNKNYSNDLHTLFLLDLDPKNNKYMSANDAIDYLLKHGIEPTCISIICAALGNKDSKVISGPLEKLKDIDMGVYPQCLIIPSKNLHFIEEDMIKHNLYK